MFHKNYLHSDQVKVKSCRCKPNTKQKCKHYIELNHQEYYNANKCARRK